MITYTKKTEDGEEVYESDDPAIMLNAVEFFKKKLDKQIDEDK